MGFSEPLRPTIAEPSVSSAPSGIPPSVRLGGLLAWLGACICFLLLQKDTALHSYFCPMRGGCETVLGSQYASFWGIPLPWFGAAFYLALLWLWLAVSAIASLRMRLTLLDGLLWLALVGLTFSAGLMYVQFAVLHAFCPLCTASAVTTVALVMTVIRARRSIVAVPSEGSRGAALTLGLFALIPALIFITGGLTKSKTPGGVLMIDLSTAHRIGAANAPVQIVVFSDFQCSFCRQLIPVLQRIRAEFPHEALIVYRHFPLVGHLRAFPAAIASECAAEQGAFWEYHDKLFAEGGDLSDARLLELAASLGLDQQRFDACLRSAPPRVVVETNLKEATELGLPGAPSVFINGRRVEGPLTYENLAGRIKEVLRASSPGAVDKP